MKSSPIFWGFKFGLNWCTGVVLALHTWLTFIFWVECISVPLLDTVQGPRGGSLSFLHLWVAVGLSFTLAAVTPMGLAKLGIAGAQGYLSHAPTRPQATLEYSMQS